MSINDKKIYNCPIDFTIGLISGKWSMWILWTLHNGNGPLRFGQIRRNIPNITEKMLMQELKKFEVYGIVNRKVYPEVPPKVEYFLTEAGKSLKPVMMLIERWGNEHLNIQKIVK